MKWITLVIPWNISRACDVCVLRHTMISLGKVTYYDWKKWHIAINFYEISHKIYDEKHIFWHHILKLLKHVLWSQTHYIACLSVFWLDSIAIAKSMSHVFSLFYQKRRFSPKNGVFHIFLNTHKNTVFHSKTSYLVLSKLLTESWYCNLVWRGFHRFWTLKWSFLPKNGVFH